MSSPSTTSCATTSRQLPPSWHPQHPHHGDEMYRGEGHAIRSNLRVRLYFTTTKILLLHPGSRELVTKFSRLSTAARMLSRASENVKLENMKPELEAFRARSAVYPCALFEVKILYFDEVGIFIRRDFGGILWVSCVLILRQIVDFSTWLQYNIPYFVDFYMFRRTSCTSMLSPARSKSFSDRKFFSFLQKEQERRK